MGRLFGTDGVRGKAGDILSPELSFKLGKVFGSVLKRDIAKPSVLIGKDTRISGDMLEAGLVAGLTAMGVDVFLAEVIPTPAIAYLVKKYNTSAGVVISASHNPFMDNGIKFFDKDGYKLSDKLEKEIEDIIFNDYDSLKNETCEHIGKKTMLNTVDEDYSKYLASCVDNYDFSGIKIAIDCANGATFKTAPLVFEKLNAEIYTIYDKPDGININENCGSTHMKNLVEFVKNNNMDIGVAYDGDGDRCFLVDELGNVIDGDMIMSICSKHLKQNGKLQKNTLVTTVMSNLGLFIMGEKEGINIEKTDVGDRYVLEKLIDIKANFGGEQSGHIIFLDYNTTGDGILTSLNVIKIMKETGKKLSELNNVMKVMPQVLVNAKVSAENKKNYVKNDKIRTEIEELEKKFGAKGRVLIRPSGTENLVRVMIEGEDEAELLKSATKLKDLMEELLCVE